MAQKIDSEWKEAEEENAEVFDRIHRPLRVQSCLRQKLRGLLGPVAWRSDLVSIPFSLFIGRGTPSSTFWKIALRGGSMEICRLPRNRSRWSPSRKSWKTPRRSAFGGQTASCPPAITAGPIVPLGKEIAIGRQRECGICIRTSGVTQSPPAEQSGYRSGAAHRERCGRRAGLSPPGPSPVPAGEPR